MRNAYRGGRIGYRTRRTSGSSGSGIVRFFMAIMLLIFSSALSAALSPGKRTRYN